MRILLFNLQMDTSITEKFLRHTEWIIWFIFSGLVENTHTHITHNCDDKVFLVFLCFLNSLKIYRALHIADDNKFY